MNERRWFNNTQPQTLQIAVILLYISAGFGLLGLITGRVGLVDLVLIPVMGLGAYGIANEQRRGYALGISGGALNLVAPFLYGFSLGQYLSYDPFGLMFAVALIALLLHPMSRDYQRIWFK